MHPPLASSSTPVLPSPPPSGLVWSVLKHAELCHLLVRASEEITSPPSRRDRLFLPVQTRQGRWVDVAPLFRDQLSSPRQPTSSLELDGEASTAAMASSPDQCRHLIRDMASMATAFPPCTTEEEEGVEGDDHGPSVVLGRDRHRGASSRREGGWWERSESDGIIVCLSDCGGCLGASFDNEEDVRNKKEEDADEEGEVSVVSMDGLSGIATSSLGSSSFDEDSSFLTSLCSSSEGTLGTDEDSSASRLSAIDNGMMVQGVVDETLSNGEEVAAGEEGSAGRKTEEEIGGAKQHHPVRRAGTCLTTAAALIVLLPACNIPLKLK